MKIEDLKKLLDNHDWFYNFSDDHSVWVRGERESAQITGALELQVYNNSDEVIHREEFDASTSITADKIALNIVEREFVGLDWTLTEIV